MKYLLLIDPLEKLVIEKDSTLLLAHTLKERGEDVGLIFSSQLHFQNVSTLTGEVYDFSSCLKENSFYLERFSLGGCQTWQLDREVTLFMRLDPPYNGRYQRVLWLLQQLQQRGVKVINDPVGIMRFNEKLTAYAQAGALASYVGADLTGFKLFLKNIKASSIILKPLDLYQGIGVERVSLDDPFIEDKFVRKVEEYDGPVVVQEFSEEIFKGEVRSFYYRRKHVASILKRPKEGSFMANVAQGAVYQETQLSDQQKLLCEKVAEELGRYGVDWIAYDLIGEHISEVNVTCPGLLVELSQAVQKNLAELIIDEVQEGL